MYSVHRGTWCAVSSGKEHRGQRASVQYSHFFMNFPTPHMRTTFFVVQRWRPGQKERIAVAMLVHAISCSTNGSQFSLVHQDRRIGRETNWWIRERSTKHDCLTPAMNKAEGSVQNRAGFRADDRTPDNSNASQNSPASTTSTSQFNRSHHDKFSHASSRS